MFCKNCGAKCEDGVKFCAGCGTALNADLTETASAPTVTASAPSIRYETKSLSVHPSDEQSTIDEYEAFGWEFLSTQTIDSAVSHEERRWDGDWSIVERRNYVKLSFRRNRNIPHYDEIVALQQKYEANEPAPYESSKMLIIIGVVAAIFLLFIPIVGTLAAVAVAIGLYTYKKKKNEEVDKNNAGKNKIQKECVEKARALLG